MAKHWKHHVPKQSKSHLDLGDLARQIPGFQDLIDERKSLEEQMSSFTNKTSDSKQLPFEPDIPSLSEQRKSYQAWAKKREQVQQKLKNNFQPKEKDDDKIISKIKRSRKKAEHDDAIISRTKRTRKKIRDGLSLVHDNRFSVGFEAKITKREDSTSNELKPRESKRVAPELDKDFRQLSVEDIKSKKPKETILDVAAKAISKDKLVTSPKKKLLKIKGFRNLMDDVTDKRKVAKDPLRFNRPKLDKPKVKRKLIDPFFKLEMDDFKAEDIGLKDDFQMNIDDLTRDIKKQSDSDTWSLNRDKKKFQL
ncbi:MAG: hypothetical protein LAT54_07415 [Cryomorphaceae bacterium]|nr:hypothetical protein [Cryomorphaceae bacterium]